MTGRVDPILVIPSRADGGGLAVAIGVSKLERNVASVGRPLATLRQLGMTRVTNLR
jgi:hypothetical protein